MEQTKSTLTPEEVGQLKCIHLLIWRLQEQTSSPELRARLLRVFAELPLSDLEVRK